MVTEGRLEKGQVGLVGQVGQVGLVGQGGLVGRSARRDVLLSA